MANDTNDRHDGIQIKVWVSEGFYDMLKALAHRRQTSVAAEARRLMVAGVEPSEALDTIVDQVTALDRFIRLHLEPLTFVAAMDAAKGAAYWKRRVYLDARAKGKDQEGAQETMERMERDMAEQATRRIRRVLREVEEPMENVEEGDGDDEADE